MSLRLGAARGLGRNLAIALIVGAISGGAASPHVAQDVTTREVDVAAPDGVPLKATLYSGRPGAPGILLLPMCDTRGGAAWAPLAAELSRNGYHVMTLNYRGTGGSGGARFQNAGLAANMGYWRTKWLPDVEAALAVLQRLPNVAPNRIAMGGASCGMFLALHVARRNTKAIEAVLALAGPTDGETKAFIAARGAPPVLGVAGENDAPALGVAGENDAPAPTWIRELVGGSRHPLSRVVVYREAGHGTEMLTREAAAIPLIADWFRRALPGEQSPRR